MSIAKTIIRSIPGTRTAYAHSRATIRRLREVRQFVRFRNRSALERPAMVPLWKERTFYLDDCTLETPYDAHYVYHTAWALRQLQQFNPVRHVDVSSQINFIALGSAIVPMLHIDYRPPRLTLTGLECGAGDLMALPFDRFSITSLSCMHVVEHIGLGRYGDPLDTRGDIKAASELQRVLAPGGRLLFVTPVGRPRVCFNAHRVYSFEMVRALFPELLLRQCDLLMDDSTQGLVHDPDPVLVDTQSYGCGCFVFERAAT